MGRFTAGVAEVLRVTFRRETLPASPAPVRPAPTRSTLSLLLAPDALPSDLPAPARLAAPGRGALDLLLAPDQLPSDLPPLPRRGGRWLAWLLSPESLDP